MKAKKYIIIGLIGLGVLGLGLGFAKPKIHKSEEIAKAMNETAQVKKGELKVEVTAKGEVVPKNLNDPNDGQLRLNVNIDEYDIRKINKDQEVSINLNSYKDKEFKGGIEEISESGKVINGIGTFDIKVDISDEIEDLKAGMTGNIEILIDKKEDVLYIPVEGIKKRDDGSYFVIIGDTLEEKTVEIGLQNNDYVEIVSGLEEGEKIQLPEKVNEQSKKKGGPFMTIK
jgi:multidrug efflux pump subunit AcrA (membrane-fusion protein)